MRGDVVHEWTASFNHIWPNPTHVRTPVDDAKTYFFSAHLFANGDLLAVFHGGNDTPYGYGLVKLDKDSKVLWKYSANVHHQVDVDEKGTIYALKQEFLHRAPDGLEYISTPVLVDTVVTLSPDGQELTTIPILEAFRDSAHATLLALLDRTPRPGGPPFLNQSKAANRYWDISHANSVKVLTPALAPRFPMFKAGQVLLSLRELDIIAVLDPQSRSIVWATCGPWRKQHDAQFLDNGRLLIFDNSGSRMTGTRVLEYDPRTQVFPWVYASTINTHEKGMGQRLPNGNTLVCNSGGELFEVTPAKELVWQCSSHGHSARRYAAESLSFLKGQRARP
jgi:hypothetical protein